VLDERLHHRTGNTLHNRFGNTINELPHSLCIEQNPDAVSEFYLIHYDQYDGEMGDTLHDSIYEAMEQAEFEFEIKKDEWTKL
jgi:hypothetical protein